MAVTTAPPTLTRRRRASADGSREVYPMAAIAKIVRRYPDGSTNECSLRIDTSYPDALAEAVARVVDLFREACKNEAFEDEDES